jgi:hypothetical protein
VTAERPYFERLAKDEFTDERHEYEARAKAFYDDEVTPRYRVLKLIGKPKVVAAARAMRQKLDAVGDLATGRYGPAVTADSPEFYAAHNDYRAARNCFTDLARCDLGQPDDDG